MMVFIVLVDVKAVVVFEVVVVMASRHCTVVDRCGYHGCGGRCGCGGYYNGRGGFGDSPTIDIV